MQDVMRLAGNLKDTVMPRQARDLEDFALLALRRKSQGLRLDSWSVPEEIVVDTTGAMGVGTYHPEHMYA